MMRAFFILAALAALSGSARAGFVDWANREAREFKLFYPGTASWEFLNGADHRLGSKMIAKGKRGCRHCHLSPGGALDIKSGEIASGTLVMKAAKRPFEPEPRLGAKGELEADMKAAYDDKYLYLRIEWVSSGSGWKGPAGGVPDRVSIQFNRGEPFRNYGCFITCHDGLSSMPGGPAQGKESRLYAYYARTPGRSAPDKALKGGGRIDLRAIEFINGGILYEDGWVFDDRVWEKADVSEAEGTWSAGRYTAIFKVRLGSQDPFDAKLKEGETVYAGVAIHDGGKQRRHYVSLPLSIGIGADGDVKATRVGGKGR